jgi:predicted negative regulator of RcsB-dependent stress response
VIDSATLISVLAVVIAGLGLMLNWKKNNKSDATEITSVIVKLETISNDTKDIKNELRNIRAEVGELRERVIIAEQTAKSLHKRVDSFETRLEH